MTSIQDRYACDVSDRMLKSILSDFFLEESLDIIWRIRTNNITLDEIYNLEPLDSFTVEEPVAEKSGNAVPSSSSANVVCPICQELVGAPRFAPHLEKCMNGGKRGTRKYSEVFLDEAYLKPVQKKPVEVDPHPQSLIVRVKLRYGEPYGNTRRIGVSTEDYEAFKLAVISK